MIARIGGVLEGIEPAVAARFLEALISDPEAARRIIKNADDLLERLSKLNARELREFIRQRRGFGRGCSDAIGVGPIRCVRRV